MKRSYEDFRVLDKHLHLCIYDRRYSELSELPRYDTLQDLVEVFDSFCHSNEILPIDPISHFLLLPNTQSVTTMLATYLSRFSSIADNKINCGPVLTWMEVSLCQPVPFFTV